jgi:hypothetical protein
MARFRLTLFITKKSAGKALEHLYRALAVIPYADYELHMIDVDENPEKANQSGIVETPALIHHTEEGDKLIGRVSNSFQVRKMLGLQNESSDCPW